MEKIKRIVLEVKEEDHREIKTMAAQLGISMKEYILKTIAKDIYEKVRYERAQRD